MKCKRTNFISHILSFNTICTIYVHLYVCSYNKQTADLIFIIKSNYFRILSIGGNDKKVMIFAQCTSEVYPIFQIQCARGLTLKTDGRSLAKARPALILSAVRNSDSLSLSLSPTSYFDKQQLSKVTMPYDRITTALVDWHPHMEVNTKHLFCKILLCKLVIVRSTEETLHSTNLRFYETLIST